MHFLYTRAIALFALLFLPTVLMAVPPDTQRLFKIREIARVVHCEDNTSAYASRLVMSVVYNRAKSYSVDKLYSEVSRKRQFSCFKLKASHKKMASKSYHKTLEIVHAFIEGKQRPTTSAKFFYNHRLVSQSALGNMKLKVVKVHGAHSYLALINPQKYLHGRDAAGA